MDPYGTGYNYLAAEDFPRDITVLYTSSMPTLDRKTKMTLSSSRLYVHHTLYADLGHPVTQFLSCGTAAANMIPISVFMAGGLEASEFKFATGNSSLHSGYYIGKDAKIQINVDIVNYDNETKDLYMVSELEYLPGKQPKMLPAEQSVINIGLCDGQDGLKVHAPKGQTKWVIKGSPITIAKDGLLANVCK
jgi:hypothetical protein